MQVPSDRLNVTSKLTTGGAINAVVAQREQRALANQLRKLDMQRKNPKLKCTLHCVCIAFKALSGGLFLLIVGTIMSVYGFFLEAEQKQKAKLNNEIVIPKGDELNARIRNLTYAGPVIMGLGIIVIIAALVLTFEVRDTLGIKEPAGGEKSGNILVEKKQKSTNFAGTKVQTIAKDSNLNENRNKNAQNADIDCQKKSETDQIAELNNDHQINNQLNTFNSPMQVCTIENELRKLSTTCNSPNIGRIKTPPDSLDLNNKLEQPDELDSLDKLTELNKSTYKHSKHKQSGGSKTRKNEQLQLSARSSKSNNMQNREILETNLDQINQTNVLKTEHDLVSSHHPNLSMSFSIDSTNLTTDNQQVEQMYFDNLPSPQEVDLSEPSELYSVSKSENQKLLKSNLDARCSCTASPDNSDQDFEANKTPTKSNDKSLDNKNKSFMDSDLNYHFVEQQKIQQQLIAQQQMLLQQQQQLTDLLQEKFINQQPRQHSLSSYPYSSLTNKSSFEQKSSKISSSFDQTTITPKYEKTISFELTKPSPSLKSLPTTFERSLGTSNKELKSSSKRIASADFVLSKEKGSKDSNQTKQMKQRSSLSASTNRPFNTTITKPNRFRTSSSSQNLEFNINMLDYKEKT